MGNKNRSRELLKQREIAEAFRHAQTETRDITSDVFVPGIGVRRVQLVEMPSFSEGCSWDVRQVNDTWTLYRATTPVGTAKAHGYTQQEASSERLQAYFDELCAINLPIKPDLSACAGADGETYQIAIFGDLGTTVRIQWWTDYPSQWNELVGVASRMISEFKRLSPMQTGQSTNGTKTEPGDAPESSS